MADVDEKGPMQPTSSFTAETTRDALIAASREIGLDARNAELLRMGENALYRLASIPIMARVGRSVKAGQKETRVAEWLASQDFPAVRLADVRQPVVIDDVVVTFWEYIDQDAEPITTADLGRMLRMLHALPASTELLLPEFSPMPKIESRLRFVGSRLTNDDRSFLLARKVELDEEFSKLEFYLGYGPVHGDAHKRNLMRDSSGNVKLIDFEDFCWGPREWDACVPAMAYQAFGWVSDAEYRRYVQSYGYDPLQWSGFSTVRAIRELNMTTWLAQQLGCSDDIDREVRLRISDLRDDQSVRHWSPF